MRFTGTYGPRTLLGCCGRNPTPTCPAAPSSTACTARVWAGDGGVLVGGRGGSGEGFNPLEGGCLGAGGVPSPWERVVLVQVVVPGSGGLGVIPARGALIPLGGGGSCPGLGGGDSGPCRELVLVSGGTLARGGRSQGWGWGPWPLHRALPSPTPISGPPNPRLLVPPPQALLRGPDQHEGALQVQGAQEEVRGGPERGPGAGRSPLPLFCRGEAGDGVVSGPVLF